MEPSFTRSTPVRRSHLARSISALGLAVLTGVLTVIISIVSPVLARAASPTIAPVQLGTSAAFSVLAHAAATIPGSTLPLQLGASTAITTDAGSTWGLPAHTVEDVATRVALNDAMSAYANLSGRATTGTLSGADLGGTTITPGIYRETSAYAMTTDMTFDAQGDPNATFVMQNDAALNTSAGTTVHLAGGATASHIYWVLGTAATLGGTTNFVGTILSHAATTVGGGSHVVGRALSVNAAVTLDGDVFADPGVVPTETRLTPNTGPVAGGTTVTVTGTGFVAGSTVSVDDGAPITPATIAADGTTLTYLSPAHAAGRVPVTVTSPPGTGGRSNPKPFTYVAVPTETAVTPNTGPVAGGTTVTVTGTGFVAGSTVSVDGGAPITPATIAADGTTLTYVSPAHPAGDAPVTVTNTGGTTGPIAFTYVSAAD